MNSLRCIARGVAMVLAMGIAWAGSPRCAMAEGRGSPGVLVLRNGNVLEGTVRLDGDYYRIDLANASLRVPVAQTEQCCGSLVEAYEQRRANRGGSSADAHLELARWCIRQGLLDQAAREMLDARRIDPGHLSLGALSLQLCQMLELRRVQAEAERSASERPAVVQSPVESATPLAPSSLNVSTEVQSQFVRSIQPMLVHGCATGGCHSPDGRQALQLDRWALEGRGNATLIRRNLASVTAQINVDDPPSSLLVRWARQSHGLTTGKASTPLAPYQAALLLQWLNAAAGMEPEPVQPEPPTAAAPTPESVPAGGGAAADELAALAAELEGAPASGTPVSSAPATKFVPRDQFDPEIFNRRRAAIAPASADGRPATIPPPAAPPTASDAGAAAATEPAAPAG